MLLLVRGHLWQIPLLYIIHMEGTIMNDFITKQVQKSAYQMEQMEEYKELHNEYKILLEKMRSGLSEEAQAILEELIEVINAREFIAREQSYKQGLKESEEIKIELFGG